MAVIEKVLDQLDLVRSRGTNRWSTRCPGHADRSPSLSIRVADDGQILFHCFAGCTVDEICAALGISVAELFPDPPKKSQKGARSRPRHWRFDWRRTAFAFQFCADGLWVRAKSVLDAARGLNTAAWTDEEHEVAINAVAGAYADLERADELEGVAFKLRVRGLTEERQRDESRSTAA